MSTPAVSDELNDRYGEPIPDDVRAERARCAHKADLVAKQYQKYSLTRIAVETVARKIRAGS